MGLTRQIEQLERELAQARTAVRAQVLAFDDLLRAKLASPVALIVAVGTGFVLGQTASAAPAAPAATRWARLALVLEQIRLASSLETSLTGLLRGV
jgi:hypothetical protein